MAGGTVPRSWQQFLGRSPGVASTGVATYVERLGQASTPVPRRSVQQSDEALDPPSVYRVDFTAGASPLSTGQLTISAIDGLVYGAGEVSAQSSTAIELSDSPSGRWQVAGMATITSTSSTDYVGANAMGPTPGSGEWSTSQGPVNPANSRFNGPLSSVWSNGVASIQWVCPAGLSSASAHLFLTAIPGGS